MSISREPRRSIPLSPSPLLRTVGTLAAAGSTEAEAPPRSPSELRRHCRVSLVRGPTVQVEIRKPDGTRLRGVVEDCCWSGAAVRFGYTADPLLGVDQVGVVVVTSPGLPDLVLRARVASADRRVSGGSRYGLEFVEESELHEQVTVEWRRFFSRRRSLRFEPRGDSAASITLEWGTGDVRARVTDASLHGIGVEVDVVAARALVVAGEVGLMLAFPGSGGTMRMRAKVRGTTPSGSNVRVGLELVRDARFDGYRARLESWVERMSITSSRSR